MKKIRLLATLLMIVMTLGTFTAYASGGDYAYSIGTNYDAGLFDSDIDTSGDATYAATAFSLAGYSSYYNIKPTVSYMTGNNPAGNPRLESNVLFFSGHGNTDHMSFNYKKSGGNYATGIIQGNYWESPTTGYKYAGVEDYNMGSVELVVFGGCNTAKGSDNITNDVVQNGASAAIGWTASVSASSHSYWLERFVDELAAGSTVAQAKQYADSFNYNDSNVRNGYIYGDTSLKLSNAVASNLKNVQIVASVDFVELQNSEKTKNRKVEIEKELRINSMKSVESGDLISLLNSEDASFSLDNYKIVEIESENSKIIEFIKLIDGCETNSGFTVFVKDELVTDIYKNNIEKCNEKTEIKKPSINEKKILEEVFNEVSLQYQVIEQNGKLVYDVNTQQFNYVVLTDYIVNEDGTLGRSEICYEVK